MKRSLCEVGAVASIDGGQLVEPVVEQLVLDAEGAHLVDERRVGAP